MIDRIEAEVQFQSTHPRKVRHYIFADVDLSAMFQSTHPRKVRLKI